MNNKYVDIKSFLVIQGLQINTVFFHFYSTENDFYIYLEFETSSIIQRSSSLSELTPIMFNMELIHLGSEAYIRSIIFRNIMLV